MKEFLGGLALVGALVAIIAVATHQPGPPGGYIERMARVVVARHVESLGGRMAGQTDAELNGVPLDAAAVEALASHWSAPALTSLTLRANGLGPIELCRFSEEAAWLHRLRWLTLEGNPVGDGGLRCLARVDLPLLHLELVDAGLSHSAVAIIREAPWAAHLRSLWLSGNQLGDDGASALAGWAGMDHVALLDLDATDISSEGARELLGSTTLAGLRTLSLRLNPLEPAVLEALLDTSCLPGLDMLSLGPAYVESDLLNRLAAARPELTLSGVAAADRSRRLEQAP